MNFTKSVKQEIDPFYQLLLLLFYAVIGAILSIIVSVLILIAFYGFSIIDHLNDIATGDLNYIYAFKMLQVITAIGTYVIPPIVLAYTEKKKTKVFYGFNKPNWQLFALVIVIMMVSMPIMEWSASINQNMVLPPFLKDIEAWMKDKEAVAMKMTEELLTVRNNWDILLNLVMIALIPAVGEELMFRGGIQRTINRIFKNQHVAIWITAVIFSAVHFQFYGFLPRVLLGAGFGYLYYYSGSLWYAMLAHFVNNAYAVCVALYMQKNNMPVSKADDPIGFEWYVYGISVILTIALFKYFKDTAQRERKLG